MWGLCERAPAYPLLLTEEILQITYTCTGVLVRTREADSTAARWRLRVCACGGLRERNGRIAAETEHSHMQINGKKEGNGERRFEPPVAPLELLWRCHDALCVRVFFFFRRRRGTNTCAGTRLCVRDVIASCFCTPHS